MNHIYLDHNSTTPIDQRVVEAMIDCYQSVKGNPASQHHYGRRSRQLLEESRETIAGLLGANLNSSTPDRLVFTSGGTEANNLAIRGLAGRPPGSIVISSIEHPSVVGPAEYLATLGFELRRANVSMDGAVDVDHVRDLIDEDTRLVSAMLGNNETGVLQPVSEIAELCDQRKIPLHTDAVQVVGKTWDRNWPSLGASALTLSAHKFHGPIGIGGLLLRHDVQPEPILFGGFQQMGLRPGTESVALAVGMSKALENWHEEAEHRMQHMTNLRDRFESKIASDAENVVIIGHNARRLPHTSNISFPGLDRQAVLMALDMAGVACSTGSACASGSSEPSPVLLAMGCEKAVVEGSLRFSLGAFTTDAEIDEAARRIIKTVNDLRRQKSR